MDERFDLGVCLGLVRQRDEAAARRLFEHLYPLVIRVVRSHRSPRVAEEDLAQEIFLKVFTRLEQYRGEVPFEHWVARVAVNTCLNILRAQKARPELRWADLSEDQAAVLEATLADEKAAPNPEGARDVVDKILECLVPADRLVISLLDLEERSVAEVSQITGWGQAMVKVRAFRARRKLRKHLERLQKHEMI
ncbi:MAG: RNA polymerase sigma factor [Verrucomicrobiota bacterium]